MMVMNYLKKRAADVSKESERPSWVSGKNSSLKAWEYVEQLRKQKELYIKRHAKATDYLTKKTYQIKGSEVAEALGINRASLNNTSSYSPHFRKYLDGVNAELAAAKEARLKRAQRDSSRGSIRSSKDQLVQANTALRRKVAELESQKTEELIRFGFDQLPLTVRKKLGID